MVKKKNKQMDDHEFSLFSKWKKDENEDDDGKVIKHFQSDTDSSDDYDSNMFRGSSDDDDRDDYDGGIKHFQD